MAGRIKHRSHRAITSPDKTVWEKPDLEPVEVDWDSVAELRDHILGTTLPPKGECYDCGRIISGERRYCGPCLAKH